jgi:hypothetical protein
MSVWGQGESGEQVPAQKCGKEETIATNKREFQALLEAVKAGAERGSGIGGGASKVQPSKFDGTASWAVFRRQFETVAEHNGWTDLGKYTHLITALQGRAAGVLHDIPKSATYEETLHALENRFWDQHFAAAYCSQLKAKKQRAGESLRDFVTTIERLAYRACPTLPEEHIRRGAGCAFVDGVGDADIKIKLLLGGERLSTRPSARSSNYRQYP